MELYKAVSPVILKDAAPDATILLDITPEKGIEHVHSRAEEPTRFDLENIAFHERVREGYMKHVGEFGKPIIIDSNRDIDSVWTDVRKAVQSLV